jgi:hypothetical protein
MLVWFCHKLRRHTCEIPSLRFLTGIYEQNKNETEKLNGWKTELTKMVSKMD